MCADRYSMCHPRFLLYKSCPLESIFNVACRSIILFSSLKLKGTIRFTELLCSSKEENSWPLVRDHWEQRNKQVLKQSFFQTGFLHHRRHRETSMITSIMLRCLLERLSPRWTWLLTTFWLSWTATDTAIKQYTKSEAVADADSRNNVDLALGE